jgi:hypothetical protein
MLLPLSDTIFPNNDISTTLLSFKEDDILLLIGRACLSLTITFAFPTVVVPARETSLRGVHDFLEKRKQMEREAAWINKFDCGVFNPKCVIFSLSESSLYKTI